MQIPDYPSNREADKGTSGHCPVQGREGVPEREAKSGDLYVYRVTPGTGRSCTMEAIFFAAVPCGGAAIFLFI